MSQSKKVKVLVVDDNPQMLEIYERMFRGETGYEVDMIDDAMDALRMLGDRSYDLIILDIVMQPLTGEAFFVYLRSDEKTMNIPVIAVTVLEPEMLETMKKLDHPTILQKPIHKEDLFDSIEKCLGVVS